MIVGRPVFFSSSSSRARRRGWLGSTALLGLSLTIASVAIGLGSAPALANGGASHNGASGGVDSPTGAGGPGADGIGASDGGAGGGAGVTGGSGGNGLALSSGGGTAGAGGTGGGGAGQAGTAGGAAGGTGSAGGGGGGGGAHGGVAAMLPGGSLTGGSGGAGGGAFNPLGFGGSGGAGGYGYVVTGTGNLGALTNSVTGGGGGTGGGGTARGGNGGTGGTGLYFSAAGATASIGAAVNGGNGGNGGPGVGGNGTGGAGGAGIVGSDLAITMNAGGSVTGGQSGLMRANAVTFTGGTNAISFFDTASHLTGNIGVTGTVQLNAATGGTTVSNAITGSGGVIQDSANTLTLSGANTYSGATTITTGSVLDAGAAGALSANSDFTVNGTLALNGFNNTIKSLSGSGIVANSDSSPATAATLTIAPASGGTTFSGTLIDGPGGALSLVKTGAGTQILSGANTYTGATTVNAGLLQLKGGAAIADTGAVVVNASGTLFVAESETIGSLAGSGNTGIGFIFGLATLTTGGDNTSTLYSGVISTGGPDPGSLVKTGAGTFTLSGANTYGGGTTIAGGTLQLGNGGTTGSIAGDVTDNAALAFNRSDAFAFGGVISGSGSVNQIGAGTTTLSAANTYTGATTISAGVLNIQNDTALGSTASGTTVASGAALELQGGITVGAEALTLNGTGVANGGALRNVSGNNTYNGPITLGSDARINADADNLHLNGGIGGAGKNLSFGVQASAIISVGSAIATGTGTLTKDGDGLLVLGGTNSYTGVTTVNAGLLQLSGSAAIADTGAVVVNASGTLFVVESETIGSLAGSGNTGIGFIFGPATLTTGGDNTSTLYSGVISAGGPDPGSLVKTGAGTFTLSGANTYGGGTTIAGGTLQLGNGGTTGSIAGDVTDNAALAFNRSDAFAFGGVISGSGSVNQIGAGTTTLSAANTYTGATTISAGVLNIRNGSALGSTASGTTVAGGAALELQNNITVGAEALTLNGTGVANGGALRNVSGNNTYNGPITLGSDARINADAGFLFIAGGIGGGHNLSFGVQAGATIGVNSAIATGTGTLTKDGDGVLAIADINTYTGVTTVNAGVLILDGGTAIADTGAVVVNAAGTLKLGASETIGSLAGSGNTTGAGAGLWTLTTGGDGTSTLYSGVISETGGGSSTGSLVKTGAGTFTLAGANTYTGTTDVNAGTLAVTGSIGSVATPAGAIGVLAGATLSVGAAGSINIAGHDLTNAGTVTVASGGSITDDLVNSGIVSNAGTYNAKVASNTGSITNASIWNGDVLSNAGSIVNDAGAIWTGNVSTGGSFTNDGTISGAVTVSGGTFKGTGSSGGLTIGSGAVFAPGNGTPGTSATVNGSLAFSSGAFYQVAINPTTASFVNATGTATLGGASVQAFFSSGTYVAKQYTILHATGGVSGTFNTLANTNLPSGFTSTLSYDGTHAYLDLALNLTPGPNFGGGLTVNQRNVATTLVNFFNSNGSIPIVFGALTPAGLTQASGELATATQQTSFDAMNLFMGVMTDPFAGGRGGVASSGSAAGYADADAYAAKRKPNDALAAIYTKARPMTPTFAQRWSTWVAGYGGSQSTDGNAALGSNNTTSSVYGTAVGADYRLSLETVAGFALAGGGTNFNVNGAGYGRSDLFQAGAFLRHTHGAAYITGALAYGWQDITTNRTVMVTGIDRLRARFNANAWSGRLEGGTRFVAPVFGGVGLTPYAAGQVTTFDLPSYTESVLAGAGAFALSYNAKSVTDTRSELGLRTDKSYAMESGILTLRGRTAWAHDFNPDRSIAATFQTLPGASFVVNGAAQAPDSLLSSEAIEFKWANGWSAAATFDSEYSSVATSYAGKGVLRYTW